MDFARKILSKYGWKDGDGLGKNNNGIAKPLKATLKFDSSGFGADQAAADFNNHWWERVFNEAANNVDVKQDGEQVQMNLKNADDGVEISTKSYSMKKLKKAKQNREVEKSYDNFLQAATLTNQGDEIENPDKIATDDIEVTKVKFLTDEELFKACGGRTAHKGARHGLKLSGKLSRIEQQEAELLAKMMENQNNVTKENTVLSKTQNKEKNQERKKKNKTKNKEKFWEECEIKLELEQVNETQDNCHKSKKNKRKLSVEEPTENEVQDLLLDKDIEHKTKKVKSKKKHKNREKEVE